MSGPSYGGPVGHPEVDTARSKLDGVLQTLMDKKEDSPMKKEAFDDDFEAINESVPNTPSKRSKQSTKQRKKRRGDDPPQQEYGQYHRTYVMKLFDRSVDLAQFDDSTPLYPVCRAWMRNQPHNQNLPAQANRNSSDEEDDDDDDSDMEEEDRPIYHLPGPISIKTEDGNIVNKDMRVPTPLPPNPHEATLDQIYQDPSIQPAPEQLLLDHMARWKHVRQKWKDASATNEARYAPSLSILKKMYDRACKD